jgi:hypothetical protein
MNIGSIIWPEDARTACNHYLDFILQVVNKLGIVFPGTRPDPRVVARQYMDDEITEEEYRAEAVAWWDSLKATGQITIFRDPAVLLMRMAICLLSATPDEAPRLGDHLSWFLELLETMGKDLRDPDAMMARHFVFAR